jgi:uncharacterized iron-regulated protein
MIAALLICALPALTQDRPRDRWLPDETAGLEKIVEVLISAFDHADILALGEFHWKKLDSDLRIALVRNAEFPKKAHFIVVEFASTAEQLILDQYIRGEDVPTAELQRVWRNTTQNRGVWESPVYADFLAAVRDENKRLPAAERIRVLAGDPPAGSRMDRDASAVSVLQKHVLKKHAKALVVYGSGHLQRTSGITWKLEHTHSRPRVFAVHTLGGPQPYFENFETALKSSARPVLLPQAQTLFGNLSYDRFTFGQLFDACVYWGMSPEVEKLVPPSAASGKP